MSNITNSKYCKATLIVQEIRPLSNRKNIFHVFRFQFLYKKTERFNQDRTTSHLSANAVGERTVTAGVANICLICLAAKEENFACRSTKNNKAACRQLYVCQ